MKRWVEMKVLFTSKEEKREIRELLEGLIKKEALPTAMKYLQPVLMIIDSIDVSGEV